LVVDWGGVFFLEELLGQLVCGWFRGCGVPGAGPDLLGGVLEGEGELLGLPGGEGGLDGALDEEAGAVAALGCAGDFLACAEDVILFCAGEADSWDGGMLFRGEVGIEAQEAESLGDPGMSMPVAFAGAELVPGLVRWDDDAVGVVLGVGDDAASRGATDEGAQVGLGCDLVVTLRVAECGGWQSPAIEPEEGFLALGSGEEQGFIERHIPGWFTGAGFEQEPMFHVG
jgi:hypothetical protein